LLDRLGRKNEWRALRSAMSRPGVSRRSDAITRRPRTARLDGPAGLGYYRPAAPAAPPLRPRLLQPG